MSKNQAYTILLVEDDGNTAKEFTDYFAELANFEITKVVNGETEAMEFINNESPSIVIVDLALWEGDGSNLVERIVKGDSLPFRPCIIVITAIGAEETREAMYDLGVNYLFGKEEVRFGPGAVAEFLFEIKDDLPLPRRKIYSVWA